MRGAGKNSFRSKFDSKGFRSLNSVFKRCLFATCTFANSFATLVQFARIMMATRVSPFKYKGDSHGCSFRTLVHAREGSRSVRALTNSHSGAGNRYTGGGSRDR